MKHINLVNHIKGSYYKAQYLEAFLVQSAYIEGLLKLSVDYSFWDKIDRNISTGERDTNFLKEVRNLVVSQNLNTNINFLEKVKLIDKGQKEQLHQYRAKRNKVLHDLVKQMNEKVFEVELKQACDLGNNIIESKEFIEAAKLLESMEEIRDAVPSSGTK